MKPRSLFILTACAALVVGCAATLPPAELIDARQAVARASTGQAAQLVPAEVHKAQEALAIAEKSFVDEPSSIRTKDLAYVADRKAKMAEALGTTAASNIAAAKAKKTFDSTQAEIVKNTKQDLSASQQDVAMKADQLAVEQKARIDADKRTADAQAELVKLAAVKEEARGLVITLSGSVLFASNKSTLLPAAQDRLKQVADALMATKERKITIEGHTDSRGSSSYNQELSLQRANAVRSFIVSRGYPETLIVAQGIGKDRPVADNTSAEGRANNRRVEIIVDRAAK